MSYYKDRLPKIIFIVGSASAGKTTLARIIKERLPFYNIINDLTELKRFQVSDKKQKEKSIKLLPSGGFDIEDPKIWDKAIVSVAKKIDSKNFYIFEFARGIDTMYLSTLGLKKHQVYNHCFEIILNSNKNIHVKNTLIISIHCDFKTRMARNKKRKRKEQHFVAEKVMREVYSEENFYYVPTKRNQGYLNKKNKILVFAIGNSKELSSETMKEYLNSKFSKALNFYISNSTSKIT